jgi:hypothetical protein
MHGKGKSSTSYNPPFFTSWAKVLGLGGILSWTSSITHLRNTGVGQVELAFMHF